MIKHGHGARGKYSPEFRSWLAMRARCRKRREYLERGITVCKEWKDFLTFFEDMGPKPSLDHTLERKNNEEGYNKNNCKWATTFEQNWNKRDRPNTSTGVSGVCYSRERQRYIARVEFKGRLFLMKRFKTLEEARVAVIAARNEIKSSLLQESEVRSEFSPADEEASPTAATGPAAEAPPLSALGEPSDC